MDSLQLYTSVYQSAGLKYDRGKLKKVDEIVQCIIEEIMVEPYDLNKSPFIKEAVRLVRYIKMSNGMNGIRICLYPYDAYVIIKALGEYIFLVFRLQHLWITRNMQVICLRECSFGEISKRK